MKKKDVYNWIKRTGQSREQGQSLVELAICTILLMFLLIGSFEMAQAFRAYIAVVNASREGADYAAMYTQLSDAAKTPIQTSCDPGVTWCSYRDRVSGEIEAAYLDSTYPTLLDIARPVAPNLGANCPIKVTVTYKLHTFTSQMRLPIVDRMGLPDYYTLVSTVEMPIRNPPATYDAAGCMCANGRTPAGACP